MKTKKLESLSEVRKELPSLIKEHGSDTDLARAAMVNPLLAMKSLGYEIPAKLEHELEYYIRFGQTKQKKLLGLEEEVRKVTGKSFDLRDQKSLEKFVHPLIGIKGKLELKSNVKNVFKLKPGSAKKVVFKKQPADPYEVYREAHPVMAPLLAYREIESSVARLGSKSLFEKVLKDKTSTKVTFNHVRFSLKTEN